MLLSGCLAIFLLTLDPRIRILLGRYPVGSDDDLKGLRNGSTPRGEGNERLWEPSVSLARPDQLKTDERFSKHFQNGEDTCYTRTDPNEAGSFTPQPSPP